jgi:hypothetical protein
MIVPVQLTVVVRENVAMAVCSLSFPGAKAPGSILKPRGSYFLLLLPAFRQTRRRRELCDDADNREAEQSEQHPPPLRQEIDRIDHPDARRRGALERGGVSRERERAHHERPRAGNRGPEHHHVPHERQRGNRAHDADDHHKDRRRLATHDAPREAECQRRQAGADQADAQKIRDDHDGRAHEAAGENRDANRERAAGIDHRRRDHRTGVETVDAKHETEESIAGEARDQPAQNEQ